MVNVDAWISSKIPVPGEGDGSLLPLTCIILSVQWQKCNCLNNALVLIIIIVVIIAVVVTLVNKKSNGTA